MKGRVLVVEDNPMNLELVTDLLEMADFEVISSDTARQAIDMMRSEHPDIILMDVALPDMDGLEATRLIKADPEIQNIPVVALTAHAMSGDAERAKAAGCNGYITKPIDTKKFAVEVEQIMKGSAAR